MGHTHPAYGPTSCTGALSTTVVVTTGSIPPYSYHPNSSRKCSHHYYAHAAPYTDGQLKKRVNYSSSYRCFILILPIHSSLTKPFYMHALMQLSSDSDEYSLELLFSLFFRIGVDTGSCSCRSDSAPTDRIIFATLILLYTHVFVKQILIIH